MPTVENSAAPGRAERARGRVVPGREQRQRDLACGCEVKNPKKVVAGLDENGEFIRQSWGFPRMGVTQQLDGL